jgi:hypothetical protein
MVSKLTDIKENVGRWLIITLLGGIMALSVYIWNSNQAQVRELKEITISLDHNKIDRDRFNETNVKLDKLNDNVTTLSLQLARHMGDKGATP